MAAYPGSTADWVNITCVAAFAVMSLVTFIWPLWGIHRRLDDAKNRGDDRGSAVYAVQSIRRSTHVLHRLVGVNAYEQVTPVGTALTNLRAKLDALETIPTWPWRPETARTLYTAILLPILLWLITRLLERVVVV